MIRSLIAAVAAAWLTIGSASAQVVVSSKIDTEGDVIGNLILATLDHGGIPTQNRLQLGATPVVRQALLAGEIDIYPEYTGNAAFFFNQAGDPLWSDAGKAYEAARQLDAEANDVIWLTPAPASNTWAIAVRSELAAENDLDDFSAFARWINDGGPVKLVASSEFVNSASALPAFQRAYSFTLKQNQLIVLSGGDTAATIRAAAQQTNGANAAMVYSTDGTLDAAGLQVLADDKAIQPVYQPTPIIRKEVLEQYPQIATLLEPVFRELTLETLQQLNAKVQIEGQPAHDVADEFLVEHGFIQD